jgi:hypothetical protein
MTRVFTRSLFVVVFLVCFTFGVVATSPAFSCGQWPHNCCAPGQTCAGGGTGTGGGGKVDAPAYPTGPESWWVALEIFFDLV